MAARRKGRERKVAAVDFANAYYTHIVYSLSEISRNVATMAAADFAAVLRRDISEIPNENSCFIKSTPTVLNVAVFSSR
jgi:hypothetical protein